MSAQSSRGVVVKKRKIAEEKSGIKVSVGVSVTKILTSASSGKAPSIVTSGSGNLDASTGDLHLMHDGDDHGGGTDSGGEEARDAGSTAAPAFDPILTARVDYDFTKKVGFGLSLGYRNSVGIQDAEAGPTLRLPIGKHASFKSALTASYPASKSSRQNYKITTLKLVTGPSYEMGRYSLGLAVTVAYAWYSKTIIF